jgi:hypothetical protein
MLALPPVSPPIGWERTLRLPRDHYVRLDSNDYSVHPSAVGRRVLIRADLDRVRAWCEDGLVADHDRIWARHQTISDPGYVKAARMLRQQRFATDHRNRGGAAPSGRLRQRIPGCRIRRRNDMVTGTKTARDVSAEIAYLTRALKRPPCANPRAGSPNGPAANRGPMRNTWRPACNARSPPGTPTAAKTASGPRGSRPAKASKISTLIMLED